MYRITASRDQEGSQRLIAQNGEGHSEMNSRTGIADRCTTSGSSGGHSMDRGVLRNEQNMESATRSIQIQYLTLNAHSESCRF